jgi:hypothetical protein
MRYLANGFLQLAMVFLLCLPSIVGTAGLGTLVLLAGADAGVAHNAVRGALESAAPWLFVMALYGPALQIVAVLLTLRVTRYSGLKSTVALGAWTVSSLALAATVLFYRVLMSTAPLP